MTTNLAPRNTTEQIRQLTVDELDAVAGAGFFGDIWDGVTDGIAAVADEVRGFFRR